MLRFIAHFEDETVEGNSLGSRDSGWISLPEKPITALEYVMPYGNSLILRGCEEYLHMVEVHQTMGQKPMIDNVYLMGRQGEKVLSYRITIFQKAENDRYKAGDITVRMLPKGREFGGGPTQGWRKGIVQ